MRLNAIFPAHSSMILAFGAGQSGFKISVATKDHREQPFFELFVTLRGKKSG
jgi:hypothetical protein